MLSEKQANEIAADGIDAWNSGDIDRIISHYEEAIEFTSPVIVQLLGDESGQLRGKENVKSYLLKGLATYPTLKFELIEVLSGISSLVIYYANHRGSHTAESMEIGSSGKVVRVVANYSPV